MFDCLLILGEVIVCASTPTPRWTPNPPTTVQPTQPSTPRSTTTPSSSPTTTTNRPTQPSTPRSTTTPSSSPSTTTNRPTPIRLVNGSDMYSGTVEVYYQGQWGSICDDYFDNKDATVICRMLNYIDSYSYVRAYSRAGFGPSQGRITIDDLRCRGDEDDIADCPSKTWLDHNCVHIEDAGVNCRAPDPTPIRLVNGPDMYSGTVEVYDEGQWGSICDNNFDNNDATVICRMLNYIDSYSYVRAYSRARFGPSQGRITIDNLRCRGDEDDIADCPSNTWLDHNCGHIEDAGVNCRAPDPTPIRLVNGPDMYSGTVEVYYQGQWGSICDDRFDNNDATVICRMLNYIDSNSNVRAYSEGHFGSSQGRITIDNLNCIGDEDDIADCPSNTWFDHDCVHGEDAGVNCRAPSG